MIDLHDDNRQSLLKRMRTAALSGAVTGGVLGGGSALLGGAKTFGSFARPALKGAAIFGAGAPTGLLAGEALLGKPKHGEVNPYMHRGLAGGALLGALAGGGGAAYLASGKKLPFAKLGAFGDKAEEAIGGLYGADNIISNKIRQWAQNPSAGNIAKASLLGGATAGVLGGHFAGEEGAGVDILNNEAESHHKKALLRRLGL